MKKMLVPALAAAALLGAGAAHAGNVQWSIGINLPPVATVITGGPVYLPPPPVVYAPPPVVYTPPPRVVYAPAPVVVHPVPRVVYSQPRVVVQPVPVVYGWEHRHGRKWKHDDHDRRDGWRDDRRDWRDRRD
jgi:hypothetical protein